MRTQVEMQLSVEFRKANALYRSGEYQAAINIYRTLAHKYPSNPIYAQALSFALTLASHRACFSRGDELKTAQTSGSGQVLGAEKTKRNFRFALIRILGNDLYPRHSEGQTLDNLKFILRSEPAFDDCIKIFIFNRILDPGMRSKLIEEVKGHSHVFYEIPFESAVYAQIPICQRPFSCVGNLSELRSYHPQKAARFVAALYRLKNNYLMNNNGARNFALDIGKQYADWIMPWDGSCTINGSQFETLVSNVDLHSAYDALLLPMRRLQARGEFPNKYGPEDAPEEPQVIVNAQSCIRFNDEFPYGRRPKVELFWHLGVEGPWDNWKDDPWDIPRRNLAAEMKAKIIPSVCLRLPSGGSKQDSNDSTGGRSRNVARLHSIVTSIASLDKKLRIPSLLPTEIERIYEGKLGFTPIIQVAQENNSDDGSDALAVYADRNDGLGERLRAILAAINLAHLTNTQFKVFWPHVVANEAVFHDIEPAEEIFQPAFVSEHFVSKTALPNKLLPVRKIRNQVDLNAQALADKGYEGWRVFQNTELRFVDEVLTGLNLDWGKRFWEIPFEDSLALVIAQAKAVEIDDGTIAIHVRGGDLIYGKYRFTRRFQQKAIPVGIALGIAEAARTNGKKPLFFVQDDEIAELVTRRGFSLVSDLYHSPLVGIKRALTDVVIMARCQIIWGGSSGFCALAARISGRTVSRSDSLIDRRTVIEWCEKFLLEERRTVSGELLAFHCAKILFEKESAELLTKLSLDEVISLARKADPLNPLYLMFELEMLGKRKYHGSAERVLADYVELSGGLEAAKNMWRHCLHAKYLGRLTMTGISEQLANFPPGLGMYMDHLKKCIPE